jgi:hypothetical protein
MKKLITSKPLLFEVSQQIINESLRNNNGRLIVSGVLQRADAKNQNGRVYPKSILMREATRYHDIYIKEKRALGELDHPDSSIVNLQNVSHNIVDMFWKGNDLYGKVEILGTPAGNILKELLKAGIKLGISSRGLGSVKELAENTLEVQDDFELIAFDFVSNPSTHGAFLAPVNEGVLIESVVSNVNTNKNEILSRKIQDVLCELNCGCSLE